MSGEGNNSSQSFDTLLENLGELCRSESLSENGLREIIGLNGCGAPNNDPMNSKSYKFFQKVCRNERVTEGILRYLLKYFPNAARHADERGRLPLHYICRDNSHVTLGMVQLLIDAFPDSLRHEDKKDSMLPLHALCRNNDLDDGEDGLAILKLLIKRCPEAVRHAARKGLPIHYGASLQSPEFCRILIKAYPESERVANDLGYLPFHRACHYNTVATVKYFYQLYPESINVADNHGHHPIYHAIMGLENSHSATDIEVLRFMLDCNPDALSSTGQTPLHIACNSKHVTLHTVELLVDAFPESVRHEDNEGCMPIHQLCGTNNLNEEVGLEILKSLLETCPESVRHFDRGSSLPLHIAAMNQSPEFCRILIETYPGSERITNGNGSPPFHYACGFNTVATAKYLLELYPESINVADIVGRCPLHHAILGLNRRKQSPETAIKMFVFLLDCNPNVVSQKLVGKLPLYFVCSGATKNKNIPRLNAYLKVLQMLYDLYPEAIESNEVTSNVGRFCQAVQKFLNTQLTYAGQARDRTLMNTRDENGQLPLHRALRDNVSLGSIKLLIKGNPSAICNFDDRGMIPLYVACQHHESVSVIEYLIGLNEVTLTTVDREGNTALHYACIGANHAIIALLLDKYGSMSVSKRNAHRQLPIDLLLQNKNEVSDKESVQYTESIYRLIRANPETLMHYDLRQTLSEDCQNRKKRKIDEV